MRHVWVIGVFMILGLSTPVLAQQTMTKGDKGWNDLQKVLQDADQRWLCKEKYYNKSAQACSDDRLKFKTDQYFEIVQTGKVLSKTEQADAQTKAAKVQPDVPMGQGANSAGLELMAVYGNVALATDHTLYKAADASGKMAVTTEGTVLRVFVKENGKWRPAAAAQVRIVAK